MTMEYPGQEDKIPAADNLQPPATAVVPNPSRRRFNRAGVGASAVLLTLASRSVLADTVCKSPSGYESMAPSMVGADQQAVCAGRTTSQWLLQDPWPVSKDTPFASIFGTGYAGLYAGASATTSTTAGAAAATTSGQKWFDPFGNNPNNSSANASATGKANANTTGKATGKANSAGNTDNTELLLQDATLFQALSGTRTPPVVKNLIAAWLNARGKYNAFPTENDVVRIFQEWTQKGYYEVRATVKWYEKDINDYLATTNSVG